MPTQQTSRTCLPSLHGIPTHEPAGDSTAGASSPEVAQSLPANYCPHQPHPTQQAFLNFTGQEALYGGAAGGGKSFALLMAALQYVHVPGYAALILRKDTQRLQLAGGLIPRSLEWLSGTQATWNASRKQWSFPTSGAAATLSFGYLASPHDKYRYGSSEFQFIAFDELTEFPQEDYLFLFSRLRRNRSLSHVPLRMRSASNPGGIGHLWVKQRFVEKQSAVGDADGALGSRSPHFFPARIADNPSLDADQYRLALSHLPPIQRERLLHGDWSVQAESQFRAEWLRYYTLMAGSDEQFEIADGAGRLSLVVRASDCRRFVTIDPACAGSEGRAPSDRASHGVIQVWDQPRGEHSQLLFLRDVWRGQVPFMDFCSQIRRTHAQWQPERLFIENEKLGVALVDTLRGEMPIETIATRGESKLVRAAPLLQKCERGEILFPRHNITWRQPLEAELLAWTGRDDQPTDQIDAAAYAARVCQDWSTGILVIQPVTWR